jgi:hypothetical protein
LRILGHESSSRDTNGTRSGTTEMSLARLPMSSHRQDSRITFATWPLLGAT